jgi:hypothetical protein
LKESAKKVKETVTHLTGKYTMNGQTLSKTREEKDVGVYLNNTLKLRNCGLILIFFNSYN